MVTKVGLDLGYANITLSDVTATVYREPSVALVDKSNHSIITVGASAENVQNPNAVIVRPFKNGLLYNSEYTRGVIAAVVSSLKATDKIRLVLGVPSSYLPKQERELFDMVTSAGVAEVYSVTRPVAALVGAGYSPTISAVSVNIGASVTEVAVLSRGEILYSASEKIGGEDFDIAVKQYIYEQGDVNVSLSVARAIKERLGAVWEGKASECIEIEGTLSLTESRVKMSVATEDVLGVFEAPLQRVITAVANAIKRIPLDRVEEIFKNGVILTGGGAEIYGMDKMIGKVLGVHVTQPQDAIDCVAKGLSRINAIIPAKMRGNAKNVTSQLSKLYECKKQKSAKQ